MRLAFFLCGWLVLALLGWGIVRGASMRDVDGDR